MLRSVGLRSGLLGVRAFSMSRVSGVMPAAASLPTDRSKSQLLATPINTSFRNMPLAIRRASTAVDTHGLTRYKYFHYVTIGMFCTIPLAINVPNPALDYALAAFVSVHAYWGFDEVITDYIHPPGLQSLVRNLWRIWVSLGFFGMLYFTYNNVGLIKAIGLLWSLN